MTALLFRDDAYLQSCETEVIAVTERGVLTNHTVFYATSGGQPGDKGVMRWTGGAMAIAATVYDETKTSSMFQRTEHCCPPLAKQSRWNWTGRTVTRSCGATP